MKIIWSPLAIDRVTEIAQYLAIDNPTAARNWVGILFDKVEILQSSPKIGRVVPELSREEIREIQYGNYRIIYHYTVQKVSVLTIRHGKQILPVDEILT